VVLCTTSHATTEERPRVELEHVRVVVAIISFARRKWLATFCVVIRIEIIAALMPSTDRRERVLLEQITRLTRILDARRTAAAVVVLVAARQILT
jgi:hypothetical protein